MARTGRPKTDNTKDKIVALRLTEEGHARLLQYADKHSLKMSDVLKKGLFDLQHRFRTPMDTKMIPIWYHFGTYRRIRLQCD